MKVSVIIPVYKVEDYLDQCVLSVVNQTCQNLEIILVNDGSPDKCPQMCDEWARKDSRIRVVHKENGGLSSARNAGLRIATGEYVYFLDSDDYLSNRAIDFLIAPILSRPETQMSIGSIMPEPQVEAKIKYYDLKYRNVPDRYDDNESIRRHFYGVGPSLPVNGVNKLIKRKLLIDNGLFFKEGILHEDEHWAFFLYKRLSHISFVKEYTYIHPVTPNSIMSTTSRRKTAENLSLIMIDALNNISKSHKKIEYTYLFRIFMRFYYDNNNLPAMRCAFWKFFNIALKKRMPLFVLPLFAMQASVACGHHGWGLVQKMYNSLI